MTHAVHFFSLVATCLWGAAGHLSWIWTAQRGTSFWDYAAALNVDKSGNIVVTGDATGSLDNNTFAGSRDVFLMKFNTSGHWHWTRQHGSSASDNARALKSDDEGNIFLAGYTFGSLDQNANVGSSDVFLSKFDNSGKLLWTKARGTSSWDYARALDIDTVGNIFMAGYTGGALDGNTHTGESDFFLMKFSADGGWQWTQQRGSDLYDYAQAVQVDRRGNVLVAGHTMGDLDGHGNAGGKDIFLAMFDKTGDWKWTQQHGGTGDDEAMAMKLDSLGNILIAGETTSSLDGCVHAGSSDMFLMKFAEDGQWQWTQQRGTPRFDAAWALEIDDSDRSVVAGYSGGALDGNQHAGSSDIFVMVFDRSGDWLWTHQRGSEHWDYVRAMQLSGPDVILVGSTQGSLDNASFHGGEDIFVMKLHSD